jgi:fido (protein-threonine AMPylation protein)
MFKNIRKINKKRYIYIDHSFRIGDKVRKKSIYLSRSFLEFETLNQKIFDSIAEERAIYIRNNLNYSKFFDYGSKNQLKNIEYIKAIFQVFNSLINKTEKEQILNEYLRKSIVNSMNMEGATITYNDATAIDEGSKNKKITATNEEILLYSQLKSAFKKANEHTLRTIRNITELHKIIYEGIYPFAGQLRKVNVTFGGNETAITYDWKGVKKGLNQALKRYKSLWNKVYEFERIIRFHIDYQGVHPFQDGNSRLGRIIMCTQFLKAGYPPLLFEAKKTASLRQALVKSVNEPKRLTPTIKYFYANFQNSFKKFWKPILEKKINQYIKEI